MELLTSEHCNEYEKKSFENLLSGNAYDVELSGALLNLSRMLHALHGIAPIVIIDEYNNPIQQGHVENFYDKVILL